MAGKACDFIGDVVREIGPAILEKCNFREKRPLTRTDMSGILSATSEIMAKKTESQVLDEDLEGEEDEQMEMSLVIAAFDLLTEVSCRSVLSVVSCRRLRASRTGVD